MMITFFNGEENDDEFFISIEGRGKKAKLEQLSNTISEKRFELKASEPVSERSERASVDFAG